MIIIKGGGIEEFIQHYSPYFDVSDLEYYFKDDLVKRYGNDGYQLFIDFIVGGNDVIERKKSR